MAYLIKTPRLKVPGLICWKSTVKYSLGDTGLFYGGNCTQKPHHLDYPGDFMLVRYRLNKPHQRINPDCYYSEHDYISMVVAYQTAFSRYPRKA